MMNNRYFKIDDTSHYVVSILIGNSPRPGFTLIQQTEDNLHVVAGWSYVDGAFIDTTAAYKSQSR